MLKPRTLCIAIPLLTFEMCIAHIFLQVPPLSTRSFVSVLSLALSSFAS